MNASFILYRRCVAVFNANKNDWLFFIMSFKSVMYCWQKRQNQHFRILSSVEICFIWLSDIYYYNNYISNKSSWYFHFCDVSFACQYIKCLRYYQNKVLIFWIRPKAGSINIELNRCCCIVWFVHFICCWENYFYIKMRWYIYKYQTIQQPLFNSMFIEPAFGRFQKIKTLFW
jgi:hypothetical protein